MPSFSFQLGLIVLAAIALRIEAQTTRLTGLRPSRGLDKHGLHNRLQEFVMSSGKRCGTSCGVRRGSSPYDKPDKFLGYSVTASQETALNATREDRFLERDLFRKPRKRRRISKRKLKKQLQECEARLQETQNALDAPRLLFIQMAQHCTLERTAGRYYLRTTDMDADTYVFTEMPLQQANVWPTSYFVGYLFDEFFPVEKPNAAFTFNVYNNQSEKTFEGPLISVLLSSHQFTLQDDNSTLVVYELAQSSEQEATSPLSRFFRGADPLGNASVTYEHCSLFIDPASENGDDSYYSAAASRDDTVDALNRAAEAVENGPAQTTPVMQTYTKVWSFEQKPLTPKDVYKGAADNMKALAGLIKECNDKECSTNDIVEGVSNMLLTAAYAIGAAFPVADTALTIIASMGFLFSSLFFDPPSSQAGAILPSQIEAAVKKGLKRYDATNDKDLIDKFSVFYKIDLDNFVRKTGSLGYIRNQKKDDFQSQIDQQVEHWKTNEYTGAWNECQTALDLIQADYDKWFGAIADENNLRVHVVHWINDNANECRVTTKPDGMPEGINYDQYPPPIYDSKEVADFQKCRINVGEGPDKWNRLIEFAEAYLYMATVMMSFASQATVIMQMTSFCNPAIFDEDTIDAKCAYNDAIRNMLSKVFVVEGHALFLRRVLAQIDDQCFQAKGWPFSQQCTPNYCNYKWSLSTSHYTYEYYIKENLNNIGFYKISTYTGGRKHNNANIYDSCHPFRTAHESEGFAYGGFWSTRRADYVLLSHKIFTNKDDDCGHLSVALPPHWNGFVFGAVPNYALKPDLPKCAALVDDPSLWGPDYSSDSPLKRFTPNLSCKGNPDSSYQIGPDESEQACWRKCYYEAKLKPTFFFSVIETFPGIEKLCFCHSTWYVIQPGQVPTTNVYSQFTPPHLPSRILKQTVTLFIGRDVPFLRRQANLAHSDRSYLLTSSLFAPSKNSPEQMSRHSHIKGCRKRHAFCQVSLGPHTLSPKSKFLEKLVIHDA